MPKNKDDYKSLLTDIIAKQGVVLGPSIALLKARSVPGLIVSDQGEVQDIQGDPEQAVKSLVDAYVDLSGQIVKNALTSVFVQHGRQDQ